VERQLHAADNAPARDYEIHLNGSLQLSALLSQFLVACTIEFDNAFERRMPHRTTNRGAIGPGPWLVALAMCFTCMRLVTDEGRTPGELTALARTDTNLNGAERWGYIMIDAPETAGRPKRVRSDSRDPADSAGQAGSTDVGTAVRRSRNPLAGAIRQS
jgi:hypothetical protein